MDAKKMAQYMAKAGFPIARPDFSPIVPYPPLRIHCFLALPARGAGRRPRLIARQPKI
jgi:hypothetical protein